MAGYKSIKISIPEPIVPQVRELVTEFKENYRQQKLNEILLARKEKQRLQAEEKLARLNNEIEAKKSKFKDSNSN